MSIDQVGHELEALGVSARDMRCLLLLPQVFVGWASERRDVSALEALLDTTARRGGFERGSVDTARGWLLNPPTRLQYQSGFALLRALRKMPGASIRSSDVLESMIWASRAAELDGESSPRAHGRVTAAARRAMLDLEAWLELDTSGLWTGSHDDFVEELSSGSASQGAGAASLEARRFDGRSSGTQLRVAPGMAADPGEPASAPFPLVRRRA
jgi:hypothetical protein